MEAIRNARRNKGYTQEQLAKLMGVSQGAITQWETGATHPSFTLIPKLAGVLGISIDELVRGGTGDDGKASIG